MSGCATHGTGLDDYAERLVRLKARQLCRRAGFNRSDEDDLQQELRLYLVAHAHRFDSTRGSQRAFTNQLVNSAVALLLRNRRRHKNSMWLSFLSLESTFVDVGGHSVPVCESVSADDVHRRTGSGARSEADLREEAEAISHVLSVTPPQLRGVVRRLMSGSPSSVARELGISRRRIYSAQRAIRVLLESAGFEEKRAQADSRPSEPHK